MRRSGARVVHAHNVHPAFGWRALAAAREAGARVVLHLHNYRLVCAIGTCFTRGEDCTRCHGRNTLPGVRLNCRGSRAESVVYGAALALWQQRLAAAVDAFVVPSEFALERLRTLGAPLDGRAHVIPSVQRSFAPSSTAGSGQFALAAGRLTPEKGFADAIAACARAEVPLVVAGDGPQLDELRAIGGDVRFVGHVGQAELASLRRQAGLAIVPSRYQEILPLAALEAMARPTFARVIEDAHGIDQRLHEARAGSAVGSAGVDIHRRALNSFLGCDLHFDLPHVSEGSPGSRSGLPGGMARRSVLRILGLLVDGDTLRLASALARFRQAHRQHAVLERSLGRVLLHFEGQRDPALEAAVDIAR